MKSNLVSKSETAAIMGELAAGWAGVELPRVKNLRVHAVDPGGEIITGGGLAILRLGSEYVPLLTQEDVLRRFPSVTVDMGAVKFMCGGANVMRPGIKEHTEFRKGGIVCVVEESRRRFLAVGKAAVSSVEADAMERGEVVRNMHYVSDRFWEAWKTIRG